MTNDISTEHRFVGSMLGLLIGDALGARFEGQSPDWIAGRFSSRRRLIERPPDGPWSYTDDTQMAIGVAEALLADGQIIESTLCEKFVANYMPHRGYGRGARAVLNAMEDGDDYKSIAERHFPGGSFGNGAAMRVGPVGLMFCDDMERVWEEARLSALPTHVHPLGIEGAQLLATAVALAVRTDEFNSTAFLGQLLERCESDEFRRRIDHASTIQGEEDLLPLGNGIAAQDSVVTAIACFAMHPQSYEDVIAQAILLGGDTDTIAAMAGAISGAFLSAAAIPAPWLAAVEDNVKGRSYVADLGKQLAAMYGASRV